MRCLILFALSLFTLNATAQQRPAITGIAFMRVYTSDPAAAEKFYGPTMGYTRHEVGGVWVYPVSKMQWIEVVPHAGPDPACMLAAVGFTTRDAAALEHYLEAHGVKPEQALHDGEFSVRDPEGNLVVFVQSAAAGSSTSNAVAKLVAASPESTTAASHRIIHVGFIVHDGAKEDAFWRDLLGFRPYWHGTMHPGQTDFVSIQVPDGTDWLEYMMMPNQQPNQHDFGMSDHFSLGVEHMQTVLAGLQSNGCEGKMCTAIQTGVDGKVQLNLFDPDQTRVEYMEFAPVMKPCCSAFTGAHPTATEIH
jgi:catechol 2,3-dioxygenase-like lactoylglutathione lyase family enzyme